MKKYMFIALAVLVAACEKPILGEEDAVTRKEANVILHMTQYEWTEQRGPYELKYGRVATDKDEVNRRRLAIVETVRLPVPPPTSRNCAHV